MQSFFPELLSIFLGSFLKEWDWKFILLLLGPIIFLFYLLFPPLRLKNFFKKYKKVVKISSFIIISSVWVLTIVTGQKFVNQQPVPADINKVTTQEEKAEDAFRANPTPEQQKPHTCQDESYKFCSAFDDLTQFEGFKSFVSDPNNSRLLRTNIAIENSKNNPNLFIKDQLFTPEINFKWKFKPNNDSVINGTIAYGEIWRCIVGENGYDRITCELYPNINTQKKRFQTYFSEVGKKSMFPKTEVTINGDTHLNNDNTLVITLTVNYTNNEQKQDNAIFNYTLPVLETEPEKMVNKFGVGIIDKEGNIRIEFLELSLF